MIDFFYKSSSRTVFEKDALSRGWLVEGKDGFYSASGVDIDHIGPVETVPVVLDEKGEVVTPAVFDTDHHVNVRLSGQMEVDEYKGLTQKELLSGTTKTEVDFAAKADLTKLGKAMGWKIKIKPRGFVALFKNSTILTPTRVWQ